MLERILKRLDPFTQLDWDALTTLAQHARLVPLAAGRRIRAVGLSRDWLGYLLDGAVRLEGPSEDQRDVLAGTATARRPLLGGVGGARSARTLTASRVLWVNVAPVTFLLDSAPTSGMRLSWLDDEPEPAGWRERFLRRGLNRGPPVLLQRLFSAFEPVAFDGEERVLEAGAPGREFYIVAEGRIEIRRRGGAKVVLGVGDAFGEEALLCDGRRNASAHALQRATLMRLDEAPFRSLLVPALVRFIPGDAIASGAVVIDLDGAARRCADPRQCLSHLSPSVPVVIAGASRAQRLHWAFLAARAGLNVTALEQ